MLTVSYDKLFAYLYKSSISKSELSKKTSVSRNTIDKMTKNEFVHMSIIISICSAYRLRLDDIMEINYDYDNTKADTNNSKK